MTEQSNLRVVVIGAGAAGMMAAAVAAERSADVVLLEKNTKAGVKILMSGGTRCNLTHDTDARGITAAFGHAQRFLQPSIGAFSPRDVVAMFNRWGVATKREATGKIFPHSDRAVEVRDALQHNAIAAGVQLRLSTAVRDLRPVDGCWEVVTDAQTWVADRVIVTSGGKSWPGCGTTGDGYGWLQRLDHTIVATAPALVPLCGDQAWMHELSGLTLDRVAASIHQLDGDRPAKKPLIRREASWLFTHFGYSGPAAMDVSRYLTGSGDTTRRRLTLDLAPDTTDAQWESFLTDRDAGGGRKRLSGLLSAWLPGRLCEAITRHCGFDGTRAELPAKTRRVLIDSIKRLPVPVTGSRGFDKAEVTAGGVALDEVDPRTMESRRHRGLYIAGEILDVDGWIGGYNFQAAFSTGRAAGIAATA